MLVEARPSGARQRLGARRSRRLRTGAALRRRASATCARASRAASASPTTSSYFIQRTWSNCRGRRNSRPVRAARARSIRVLRAVPVEPDLDNGVRATDLPLNGRRRSSSTSWRRRHRRRLDRRGARRGDARRRGAAARIRARPRRRPDGEHAHLTITPAAGATKGLRPYRLLSTLGGIQDVWFGVVDPSVRRPNGCAIRPVCERPLHLPVVDGDAAAPPRRRHPEWIRAKLPTKPAFFELRAMVQGARAPHRVRERELPEHRRVLDPPRAHDHDPRRHLHAVLPVLRRHDRPPAAAGSRRAAPRRRDARPARRSSTP